MFVIAIDGACRRNGKPDCVSAGGVFIQHYENDDMVSTMTMSSYELQSTNQRGEMLALIQALGYTCMANQDAQIITDSEYLFNAMTKDWVSNWRNKRWVTAAGNAVKNKDLWEELYEVYTRCLNSGLDIVFYHIKGHVISFGKATANALLSKDTSGTLLMTSVYDKYASVCDTTKKEELSKVNELSIKNNGFTLPPKELCRFVVANTVADAVATKCVDAADALCNR